MGVRRARELKLRFPTVFASKIGSRNVFKLFLRFDRYIRQLYGHEILHLESVGSVHCVAAGLDSPACLLLPLLGSAAPSAAVADRHKSTGLCDDEIFVGIALLDHLVVHSQRRAASRGRSVSQWW